MYGIAMSANEMHAQAGDAQIVAVYAGEIGYAKRDRSGDMSGII